MPRAYRIPTLRLADGLEEEVTVREHPTARRARLKVVPPGRIEAVVPRGFGTRRLRAFVESNRNWLMETLQRSRVEWAGGFLPSEVTLAAVGQQWAVSSRRGDRALVREGQGGLTVQGPDDAGMAAALRRWLLRKGRLHLQPWLAEVARETGLHYRSVTIRAQRTRWGSCSARLGINLNCGLLLLSAPLVRYVLVHELCHTRHLNHSPAFWALVARHEPDHGALETELRNAGRQIPIWLRYP